MVYRLRERRGINIINIFISIVCSFLLLTYLALFLFFISVMYQKEKFLFSGQPSFLKPFLAIAVLLRKKHGTPKKISAARMQKQMQIKKQFKIINPSESINMQWECFECERLAWILLSFFVGIAFCLCLTISNMMTPILQGGNTLERSEYGMGKKEIDLVAAYDGIKEKMHLIVREREYTNEELIEFLRIAEEDIAKQILGENESLEHICRNLYLMKELEGTPFSISWEVSDYQMIDLDGVVHNERIEEPQVVTLTATLSYLEKKYYIPVNVVIEPRVYSQNELQAIELANLINQRDISSKDKKEFVLPDKMEKASQPKEIIWAEEQSLDCVWICIITVLAAVIIYIAKGNDLQKKIKAREKELALDYSELIHKLTLYLNAGMTMRNIFLKLKDDYLRRKGNKKIYLYEEIMMTCYEIQTGISEMEAYENFGKRCGLRQYIRLSALLSQNLKKGSTNLMLTLEQEARDAFEARKNMARRMGEEAGTKILGPMIMMLGVVLVMIMIPAYLSFSM